MKKIIKKGSAVLLSATTFLTGCAHTQKKTNNNFINIDSLISYSNESNNSIISNEISDNINSNESDSIISNEISDNIISNESNNLMDLSFIDDIQVEVNETSKNSVYQYINNLEVNYKFEELLNINSTLDKYNSLKFSNIVSHDIIKDNIIDNNMLFDRVKKNNIEYINNQTIKVNEIDDSTLKRIIDIVTDELNKKLKTESNKMNLNSIDNTLKNLKIFEGTGYGYAYVKVEEPIMFVCLKTIDVLQKNESNFDCFEHIIRHETNHIIQSDYSNPEGVLYNIGPIYAFESKDVNPLYWNWYTEASAESLTSDNIDYTYGNLIDILDSIKISTMISTDKELMDFEQLSYQNDIKKIFEYFDVKNEQEKEEIIKMMYSGNLIGDYALEFYESIEKNNNVDLSYMEKETIKGNVRCSMALSISKIFYKNMIDIIYNNNVKLKDIFLLIETFETSISKLINMATKESKIQFKEDYCNIKNEFFELFDIDYKQEFNAYSDIIYNDSKCNKDIDSNIEFLSKDENQFVKKIIKDKKSFIVNSSDYGL